MGKHILETVFGMITQIVVMDWWVKRSSSVGAVLAAHASVHRAHTCEVSVLTSPSPAPCSKSGS